MERGRLQPTNLFNPLHVEEFTTVSQALKTGKVKGDSDLFVFQIDGQAVAFSKHKMAFHHIAQGTIHETPFMLTFCVICNSGTVLSPIVNSEILHFEIAGTYNGMLLMEDLETHSYWDHITGNCISGVHEGQQLDILQSHQLLPAKEVIELHPDCLFGREKMNIFQKLFTAFLNMKASINGQGFLPPGFRDSMQTIDDRLPEMEMGIGIFDGKSARFYPLKSIKAAGNYLLDEWNGRGLLIYISPTTRTPDVLYQSKMPDITMSETRVDFSDGSYLQSGNRYSAAGESLVVDRPTQIFLRWYGFVSTFPNCEIPSISVPI